VAGDDTSAQISRSFVFGAAGELLGPLLLIGVAAAGFGWRNAFGVAAALTAVYAVWLATYRLPAPRPHGDDESPRGGLAKILRDPQVWYLGGLALVLGTLDEEFVAFLIAYLRSDRGVSVELATSLAFVAALGSLVGFVSTSRRGYRPHRRSLRDHAIWMLGAGLVALASPSLVLTAVAVLVFGVAVARYWIALKTRIVDLHPERRGTVGAVITTIEFSGFVLPLVCGSIADGFGVRAGFASTVGFAALSLLLVVAGDRVQARSARAI
jgi:predicted MFS family arabinose efflux permease